MTNKRRQLRCVLLLSLTALWCGGRGWSGEQTTPVPDQQDPRTSASIQQPGGTWVVKPGEPGPDLPPAGRSLFDHLVNDTDAAQPAYSIPFPFTALRQRLAAQLLDDGHGRPGFREVLIPLGRSLQRTAAAPDFFHYPRLVLAVDGEPAPATGSTGMYLKDRLYLGYLEKSGVLEVISYNEMAGRFEFQIVRNYREGVEPELVYANRAVCTACHQNATPIFSRPLWGETNADTRIAARLGQEPRDFYGIPVKVGIDVPNAIDDATDRANRIPVVQFLWQQGCGSEPNSVETRRCRGQALGFALRYRLTGALAFTRTDDADWSAFVETFETGFLSRWPQGLLIADPDIPNRIPLARDDPLPGPGTHEPVTAPGHGALHRQLHVRAALDPLRTRPPLEKWRAEGSARRFITYLADFFAETDIEKLDRGLFERANGQDGTRLQYHGNCELIRKPRPADQIRISLHCEASVAEGSPGFKLDGRVYLHNGSVTRGTIDELSLDDAPGLIDLRASGATLDKDGEEGSGLALQLSRASRHVRDAAGNAIESLQIEWPAQAAESTASDAPTPLRGPGLVRLRADFAALPGAISELAVQTGNDRDALSALPLRRAAVLTELFPRLGIPVEQACCQDATALPAAALDTRKMARQAPDASYRRDSSGPAASFYRHCGRCHQGSERFPPGFLHGNPAQVQNRLAQCAERLYLRLHMWAVPAEQRTKTPMPPSHALTQTGISTGDWLRSPDLAAMQRYIHELLESQTGQQPEPGQLAARGYENLRSCLQETDGVSHGN